MERYPTQSWIEKLVLLKWPHYSKQSSDLMLSLSSYPWLFHRTKTNNPKI